MNNSTPLYILLHIHKCAGFVMSSHLLRNLRPGQYCGLYKRMNPFFENRSFIGAYFESLSPSQINRLRVIAGHGAYYGLHIRFSRPVRYIVFLRDPYKRSLSHYAYLLAGVGNRERKKYLTAPYSILDGRGRPYAFSEWMKRRVDVHDYMTRFLYFKFFYQHVLGEVTDAHLAKVLGILKKFYFVGLVEHPADHRFFYESLGVPVSVPHENVTDKQYYPVGVKREDIQPYIRQDMKLYAYIQKYPPLKLSKSKKLELSLRHLTHKFAQV